LEKGGKGGKLTVCDRYTSKSTDPVCTVVEESHTVSSDTVFGDASWYVGIEKIESGNVDIFATNVILRSKQVVNNPVPSRPERDVAYLIRSRHSFVEDIEGDFDESRVSDPSSVVSSVAFALLVGSYFVHDSVVLGFVVLDGNLCSHTSDSSNTSPRRGEREDNPRSVSSSAEVFNLMQRTCDRS
jgi:hypothetical protein